MTLAVGQAVAGFDQTLWTCEDGADPKSQFLRGLEYGRARGGGVHDAGLKDQAVSGFDQTLWACERGAAPKKNFR